MQNETYIFFRWNKHIRKNVQQAQTFSGEIGNFEKLMEHEIYIFQMKHAGKLIMK